MKSLALVVVAIVLGCSAGLFVQPGNGDMKDGKTQAGDVTSKANLDKAEVTKVAQYKRAVLSRLRTAFVVARVDDSLLCGANSANYKSRLEKAVERQFIEHLGSFDIEPVSIERSVKPGCCMVHLDLSGNCIADNTVSFKIGLTIMDFADGNKAFNPIPESENKFVIWKREVSGKLPTEQATNSIMKALYDLQFDFSSEVIASRKSR